MMYYFIVPVVGWWIIDRTGSSQATMPGLSFSNFGTANGRVPAFDTTGSRPRPIRPPLTFVIQFRWFRSLCMWPTVGPAEGATPSIANRSETRMMGSGPPATFIPSFEIVAAPMLPLLFVPVPPSSFC